MVNHTFTFTNKSTNVKKERKEKKRKKCQKRYDVINIMSWAVVKKLFKGMLLYGDVKMHLGGGA